MKLIFHFKNPLTLFEHKGMSTVQTSVEFENRAKCFEKLIFTFTRSFLLPLSVSKAQLYNISQTALHSRLSSCRQYHLQTLTICNAKRVAAGDMVSLITSLLKWAPFVRKTRRPLLQSAGISSGITPYIPSQPLSGLIYFWDAHNAHLGNALWNSWAPIKVLRYVLSY